MTLKNCNRRRMTRIGKRLWNCGQHSFLPPAKGKPGYWDHWRKLKAEHDKRTAAEAEPLKERNYREYGAEPAPLELVRE